MQVIDILRHDGYIEVFFQLCQRVMRRIGFHIGRLFPPLVIKIQYQLLVPDPGLRRSHIFNPEIIPKPIIVPKSTDPALSADPCSGKYNQFFHGLLRLCVFNLFLSLSWQRASWLPEPSQRRQVYVPRVPQACRAFPPPVSIPGRR
ncbi:hypothetical protein D3C87_1751590 [compost metagenome]